MLGTVLEAGDKSGEQNIEIIPAVVEGIACWKGLAVIVKFINIHRDHTLSE